MVTMEAEVQDHRPLIPKVREKFDEIYADGIKSGAYDERDLERIRFSDDHVLNYIKHQKGEPEKAAAMIDLSLKFRKLHELNDLTEKSFPRQLHDVGGCFYHSEDKNGHQILFFKMKKFKKDQDKPTLKKFIAWWIDKHYLSCPLESIVVVFDMTDTGISNVDIDLLKFQIACFTTFFPAMLEYMLIYEMPWVLNAIWKVIKNLLTAEQQKRVIFVSKSNVSQYFNKDQLLLHMGGTDRYEYLYLPTEDSGLESLNGEVTTPDFEEAKDLSSSPMNEKLPEIETVKPGSIGSTQNPKKKVTFAEQDQLQMMYSSVDAGDGDLSPGGRPKIIYKPSTNLNNFHRRRSKDGDSFVGTLLTISPSEELSFIGSEDKRESLDVVSLWNNSDKHVAFKVKTTSPERYRVRVSTGIVRPNSTVDIQVYLHPGNQSMVTKDKFLLMYMAVESDTGALQVNELFKTTPKEQFMEHKLRCKFTQVTSAVQSGETKKDQLQTLVTEVDSLKSTCSNLERSVRRILVLLILLVVMSACLFVGFGLAFHFQVQPFGSNTLSTCISPKFKA